MSTRLAFDRFIPVILIVLATVAVYLQVGGHLFIAYDDPIHVYENPYVLRGSAADFAHFWVTPYERLYIPVSYNLWTLLAKLARWFPPDPLGRINPGVFHVANLLLHLFNSLLVYSILTRLLKEKRAALAGALLFALHPLQVEPVAWISGLRDLLSAFWGLLALRQYLSYCEPGDQGRNHYLSYIGATGFFLLAILAKPTGMVVAAMAGLAGYFLLQRPLVRLVRELAPWCLLAMAGLILVGFSQASPPGAFMPAFWQRFLVGGDAVFFYLGKLLLPVNLGIDYGRAPQYVLTQSWIWCTGSAPYLLAGLMLWKGRRTWLVAFGIFLVGLAPTLGFISFDFQRFSTVADRYLYLAMLGPAFAAGLLLKAHRHRALRMVFALLLIGLGMKSFVQAGCWDNGFTLYDEALRVNPNSWLAHNNLGLKYLRKGQPEKAVELFKKAIELRPLNAKAYNNLGKTWEELGRPKRAIKRYREALALAPKSHVIAYNLADAYWKDGAFTEALETFQKSILNKPDFGEAYNIMGIIYCQIAKPDEAIAAFEKAIEVAPEEASAYFNLGKLQADSGNVEEAIPLFDKALNLDAGQAQAAFNLGTSYEKIGETAAALLAFNSAVEIQPNYDLAWLRLGDLHRKNNESQQAIEAYNQALAANPGLEEAYRELADLYQDLGQANEANSVLLGLAEVTSATAPDENYDEAEQPKAFLEPVNSGLDLLAAQSSYLP